MQPPARAVIFLLSAVLLLAAVPVRAQQTLTVAVLGNSPPMSYREADGRLTGFNIEIARALCAEIGANCNFRETTLNRVIDALAEDEFDFAAISLLDTPERRARVLMSAPYYRSITLWYAGEGVQPGQPGQRVAVVRGSAQEAYARKQGWETVGVLTHPDIVAPLAAGIAHGALLPMNSGIGLQRNPEFQRLGLTPVVVKAPDLLTNVCFAVNPRQADLKTALDAAIDRIKRNGAYDRINTQFLPFRVQ
jgi:ABC-type amino acid transport substrate-binding protein